MSRLSYQVVTLLAAMAATELGGSIVSAQQPEAAAQQSAPAASAADDARFTIPEGNDPEKLNKFLSGLMEAEVQEQTPAAFRAHFGRLYGLSQEVLKRNADDDTNLLAIGIMSGSLDLLDQLGDRTAVERKFKLIKELKQDQRPAIASFGRLLDVQTQLSRVNPQDTVAVKAVANQVSQLLQEKPLTIDHGRLAMAMMSVLEQSGEPQLLSASAEAFATALKASEDQTLVSMATILEGTARRLNLKGNPVAISGKTVSGEDFNIEQWKGKVVIVDFWATWCGVCIEEMPNLRALYDAHHQDGLEIVGISLDESRQNLENFLHERGLPWPTLFVDPEGKDSWDNPLATYYGISSLPTTFLVGRDGKVVAVDLFGTDLRDAVVKLIKAQ